MTPWDVPPDFEKPPLPRPEITKDPVTGLWPGQLEPTDIPDFLRRKPK